MTPECGAARLEHRIREHAHHAVLAAAINEADAGIAQTETEVTGGGGKLRTQSLVREPQNTATELIPVINVSLMVVSAGYGG